ncbi:hypothetical protein MYX64_00095 [Nitrospinae bacterium AH_259_B05_G02_I21]|nr:hypothetical protein [Nitrospinae bacterium AH_259_B05_G02_I21]MDA2932630.1 hypothetical protein [Nitrospinae bacterium AH-259-F20]MDV2504516.1 hypothetical protein [bacterium]
MNYHTSVSGLGVRWLCLMGLVGGLLLLVGGAGPGAGTTHRLKATNYLGSAGTRPAHVLQYEGQPKATAPWWHPDTYRIVIRDANHQVIFDGTPRKIAKLAALPKDMAYVRIWNRRPGYMGKALTLRIETP